ncbi:MAG: hypothetical protein Ct9H300mP16_05360 [Pseudomonadota bacterium]|nr:MAG: hypothetical protein Ct9H300mP16_05360 [Pseudomonadota bacterium]
MVKFGGEWLFCFSLPLQPSYPGCPPNLTRWIPPQRGTLLMPLIWARRLIGGEPETAAQRGKDWPGEVIRYRGAVIAADDMPDVFGPPG